MNVLIPQCVFFAILFNSVFLNKNSFIELPSVNVTSPNNTLFHKVVTFLKNVIITTRSNDAGRIWRSIMNYTKETVGKEWSVPPIEKGNETNTNLTSTDIRSQDEKALTPAVKKNHLGRRQIERAPPNAVKMERDHEITPREEGFYEPYWKSGEWVYLRTASPMTTKVGGQAKTTSAMELYRECDGSCSYYFLKYGAICGHRFDTQLWIYFYQNFTNICDLEWSNCMDATMRPSKSKLFLTAHAGPFLSKCLSFLILCCSVEYITRMWRPLHRGRCRELDDFVIIPQHHTQIMQRKRTWDEFEYTTTTPMPSSTTVTIRTTKKTAKGIKFL